MGLPAASQPARILGGRVRPIHRPSIATPYGGTGVDIFSRGHDRRRRRWGQPPLHPRCISGSGGQWSAEPNLGFGRPWVLAPHGGGGVDAPRRTVEWLRRGSEALPLDSGNPPAIRGTPGTLWPVRAGSTRAGRLHRSSRTATRPVAQAGDPPTNPVRPRVAPRMVGGRATGAAMANSDVCMPPGEGRGLRAPRPADAPVVGAEFPASGAGRSTPKEPIRDIVFLGRGMASWGEASNAQPQARPHPAGERGRAPIGAGPTASRPRLPARSRTTARR